MASAKSESTSIPFISDAPKGSNQHKADGLIVAGLWKELIPFYLGMIPDVILPRYVGVYVRRELAKKGNVWTEKRKRKHYATRRAKENRKYAEKRAPTRSLYTGTTHGRYVWLKHWILQEERRGRKPVGTWNLPEDAWEAFWEAAPLVNGLPLAMYRGRGHKAYNLRLIDKSLGYRIDNLCVSAPRAKPADETIEFYRFDRRRIKRRWLAPGAGRDNHQPRRYRTDAKGGQLGSLQASATGTVYEARAAWRERYPKKAKGGFRRPPRRHAPASPKSPPESD